MIVFIHPWNGNNAGQTKKFDNAEEYRLIECGLAVLVSKNEQELEVTAMHDDKPRLRKK